MSKPIYVGIDIASDMESLWDKTQSPSHHERWDLRFSSIRYLPKDQEDDPQQFEYATRLGMGLRVVGWGESIATREQDRSRTSSLRFGSEQKISLITQGSGYWKYTPIEGCIRFETGYDYQVRYGLLGRAFDVLVFRPLIGWATAWSFDRLRLWIKSGIDPTLSALRSLVHAASRVALAAVFLWHGLVPKLITQHSEEIRLIEASGISSDSARQLVMVAGTFEVMFAVVLILLWYARWLYVFTGIVLALLVIPALSADAGLISDPFSPITLTIAMIALCLVGWLSCVDLPRAARCARAKSLMERKERRA